MKEGVTTTVKRKPYLLQNLHKSRTREQFIVGEGLGNNIHHPIPMVKTERYCENETKLAHRTSIAIKRLKTFCSYEGR